MQVVKPNCPMKCFAYSGDKHFPIDSKAKRKAEDTAFDDDMGIKEKNLILRRFPSETYGGGDEGRLYPPTFGQSKRLINNHIK
ncbi:hypothetical protein SAMN04488002_1152 [Litoreibacter janthinus]|uniref:Uncharacterized protein n=1 Tax=Litoreibacter janthinus TaxID=670154 RepID=A0A1I6GAP2_9RHOB|nr:hypothetical protein SAMN04488002_1152 [Litoreibacter janthinus]